MRDVCFERVIFGDCGTGPNEILCEEKEIILRPDRGLNIPCLHRGGSSRGPEFLFLFFFALWDRLYVSIITYVLYMI